MRNYNIEITESFIVDETGKRVSVFGLIIDNGNTCLCYPDLVTNKATLLRLCSVLDDEMPSERLLLELFDDYLF